jgi:hypothetical protein
MGRQTPVTDTGKRKQVAEPSADLIEEVTGFTQSQLDGLRQEALHDLYFMAKGILGYNDCQPHVVGPLAAFMTESKSMTRMQLMPRGHLKTTICTISDSVRLACADPEGASILVVNEIQDNAIDIVSEVMTHFETNEILRAMFPDIIPEKFNGAGSKWSATRGACLLPRMGRKDPSFMAAGIKTAIASKHFKHIKLDDLVSFEANRSPAELKYAMQWVQNITPLTLGPDLTTVDFTGTRWALNDLYSFIMDLYGDNIDVFRRGMTENGKPIWPERYTEKSILQLMKSPDVYYSQYDNDPQNNAAADFSVEKIGSWLRRGENVVYKLAGEEYETPVEKLNRMITVDPNSGSKTATDEAGCIVIGIDHTDARICLEDLSARHTPTELVSAVCNAAERWGVNTIGVEEAGQQNTMFYVKKEARERGIFVRFVPLKHGNVKKEDRIRKSLAPLMDDGLIFLHPMQTELRKQFLNFGSGICDRLDAFSYHTHIVRAPLSELKRKEKRETVNKVLAMRSSTTGY